MEITRDYLLSERARLDGEYAKAKLAVQDAIAVMGAYQGAIQIVDGQLARLDTPEPPAPSAPATAEVKEV